MPPAPERRRATTPAPGRGERPMDEQERRLAREMTDAIAKAIAADTRVQAIRRRARAAGFDMRVSLEATIRFTNGASPDAGQPLEVGASAQPPGPVELSESDRRFLRSLRIAAPASTGAD